MIGSLADIELALRIYKSPQLRGRLLRAKAVRLMSKPQQIARNAKTLAAIKAAKADEVTEVPLDDL